MRIMRRFGNLSLRGKLMAIIMLTSTISLSLVGGALVLYERMTFEHELELQVSALADVLVSDGAASFALRDPRTATETLNSLRSSPSRQMRSEGGLRESLEPLSDESYTEIGKGAQPLVFGHTRPIVRAISYR